MTDRLLVIGGDAGGMSAAAETRRRRSEEDLEIVAFERGEFTSYSACGIPYWIGDLVPEHQDLIARTPEEHRRRGIDVRMHHEVEDVDLDERTVTVRALDDGRTAREGFDHLLVATGATPRRPPLPGIDAAGIHGVQSLEDGRRVKRELRERQPESAVIVGGGYIGLEMADALLERGLNVTVIEREDQPMLSFDADMGAIVADTMRSEGIEVRCREAVTGFEVDDDGRVSHVVTEDAALPAELVILGLGVQPEVSLASGAGIGIGDDGGITVDRRMRTTVDGVWAAGDCTEKFHRITGRDRAIALGTHANKQGIVAGTNLGGGYATFPGVVGTAVSKVCDLEVARTGLTEDESGDAGFVVTATTVEARTRARYYPGAAPMTVKLVVEQGGGRLLGGQIVGGPGAGKRIDVLASALWSGWTVSELINVDLAYAPPVSPVWDPVLIAARRAAKEGGR